MSDLKNLCAGLRARTFWGLLSFSTNLQTKKLLFPFINNVYTNSSKRCGEDVFGEKGLTEAEAGCDSAYDWDERIPDGNLANRIAGKQLVVEGKPDGRDTNQHEQIEQAKQRDMGQRTT